MDTVTKVQERVQQSQTLKDNYLSGRSYETGLKEYLDVEDLVFNEDQASRLMQINVYAYWKVITKRVCDIIPMEIRFSLSEGLLEEADKAILAVVSSSTDIEALMEVQPELQTKRLQLEKSISVLRESYATLTNAISFRNSIS